MVTITHLRCEYQTNPLGIDILQPRLSWQLTSETRGARQSAYQIVAAPTAQALQSQENLLWDSGKILSEQSIHIPYAGPRLQSGQRVWWQVRVWDKNEQPSAYSGPAWWEMGLLQPTDWQAAWIGGALAGGPYTSVPCPFLRRDFDLPQPVTSARLYITALGLYEAYLNGQRIGEDVLTPGWTDYHQRVRYQVYDVTAQIKAGRNAIGAILGDGWYCGYVAWEERQLYGNRARLLAQLVVTLADGSTTMITTDNTWKHAFGPLLASDLLMGESYDARREFPGWNEAGFNDTAWFPVEVFADPDIVLQAGNGPMIRRIEELPPLGEPVEIPGGRQSRWIIDFGQNMVGRVRLKVQGPAGTTITLRHGEILAADGQLYTENLRTARQTDHYTLYGEGEEIFEPRFTFHGFRYVEVNGLPYPPRPDTLTGIVLHSATPPSGTFTCSDPLVNQLQHNIIWGQKGNFVDVPTDCPQRDERLGWTGDAQVFVRTATFNMDVAAFFTKWQQDLADAQFSSGIVPAVAPITRTFQPEGREVPGGPAWEDAFIICPWTIYLIYGDKRLLETYYPAMARFFDFLGSRNLHLNRPDEPDRWLTEGYGDWLATDAAPGERVGRTPKDLIGTAFYAHDARLMAHIAAILGKNNDAEKYEQRFQQIRRAFIERYVTATGLVAGETQTAYVLALHFDLLPENLRPAAMRELIHNIETNNMHLTTGFVGTPYLPHVLTDGGRIDVAYQLLLQKTWPSWLYPVTQGATTIWERWDGWTEENGFQNPRMNSFNHYAYGSIGDWLYARVAGIEVDPVLPGFKHIILQPQPGGGLTWAKASFDSVHGPVVSDWRIEQDVFHWHISIPPNTTATVYIPANESSRITESDTPIDQAEGITPLRRNVTSALFEVVSGRYHFQVGGN